MALARQCTGHDYEPTNKNWVAVEVTRLMYNMGENRSCCIKFLASALQVNIASLPLAPHSLIK